MGMANGALALVLMMVSLHVEISFGAIYKVGDSAGWTTIGNVDYKQWAASKTFELGDIITFEYNSRFHNVMRVSHSEYRSCIASSPLNTFSTGNDSYTVTTRGHHYFMCGVPGHCQSGQKVDINVPRYPSSLGLSPSSPSPFSSPPSATTNTTAPAPSSSNARASKIKFYDFGVALFVAMAFLRVFLSSLA